MSFHFNYVINMGFPNSRSWKLVYWQPVGGAVTEHGCWTFLNKEYLSIYHLINKVTHSVLNRS